MRPPGLRYEKSLWFKGYRFVGGVDEVGRGSFAGPVVAGCVVFPRGMNKINFSARVDDSKKLTPLQREKAEEEIKKICLAWGVGEVSAADINRLGMARAIKKAFRKAISECRKRLGEGIDFLLIDAFFIPYARGLPIRRRKDRKGKWRRKTSGKQMAIVNGDEKCFSIAAASIIAKVYRDKMMLRLSKNPKYSNYAWDRNKGYGTGEHQKAIKKYGLTRYHRKAFVRNPAS